MKIIIRNWNLLKSQQLFMMILYCSKLVNKIVVMLSSMDVYNIVNSFYFIVHTIYIEGIYLMNLMNLMGNIVKISDTFVYIIWCVF